MKTFPSGTNLLPEPKRLAVKVEMPREPVWLLLRKGRLHHDLAAMLFLHANNRQADHQRAMMRLHSRPSVRFFPFKCQLGF